MAVKGVYSQPCGTFAAYKRHRKAGEQACELCMEGMRQASRRSQCSRCGRAVSVSKNSREDRVCVECRRDARMAECPACGGRFDPGWRRNRNGKPNVYCSQDCRVRAGGAANNTPRTKRICEQCGQSYTPWRTVTRQGKATRFCSAACFQQSRAQPEPELPRHLVLMEVGTCTECGESLLPGKWRRRAHYGCARRRSNRQASQSIMKRYREDPEFRSLVISRAQNRRVRDLGLEGITSPASLVTFLMDRDQGTCGICHNEVADLTGPMRPSIDHIVPLARGGLHVVENLQLAHYRCNLAKHDQLQEELGSNRTGVRQSNGYHCG